LAAFGNKLYIIFGNAEFFKKIFSKIKKIVKKNKKIFSNI